MNSEKTGSNEKRTGRSLALLLSFLMIFSILAVYIPSAFAEEGSQPTDIVQPSEEPAPEPAVSPEPSPEEEPSEPPAESGQGRSVKGRSDISALKAMIEGLSDSQKKLSTKLLQLTGSINLPSGMTRDRLAAQMRSQKQITGTASGENDLTGLDVYVYIKVREGCGFDTLEPYVTKIMNRDAAEGLCAAWVGVGTLERIAALDEVINIREVFAPVVRSGSVTSEGDSILQANLVRGLGADGTGVKVGIISDGVDHLADAKASGDLPSDVTVLRNIQGGDEGTAMLEIVYDLAPGADLYFHDCGASMLEFNSAIDSLVAAGCTVICDDIGWMDEPYFEDGVIGTHIKSVLAANPGVVYVSSAGNDADSHYQGRAYLVEDCVDFSRGTGKPCLYVYLPPGAEVTAVLQWNDPFGNSSNNYEMELYESDYYDDGYLDDFIDGSYNPQYGYGCYPFEYVYGKNHEDDGMIAAIFVCAYWEEWGDPLPTGKTLEVYINTSGTVLSDNIVAADSIYGHPAIPGVIACGAIGADDTGTIEDFSSRGPVTMLSGTKRAKPDICGIDGVSVTGAGGFYNPFYGTSAAAPHIAAVAALLKSRFPAKTGSQLRQIILDNRFDLGANGYDYTYGWGRSSAYGAATSSNYVTFDIMGGHFAPPKQLVVRNGKAVKPSDPAKPPYYFEGWYTNKNFAPEYKWNFAVNTVGFDVTLYANYTLRYNISASPNSTYYGSVTGGGVYNDPIPYNGESVTLTATPKNGYRFISWTEGTEVVTADAVYSFTAVSDRTFKAVFAPIDKPAISSITCPTYNTVALTWNAVDAAAGYEVYRATSSGGTYKKIPVIITETSCTDTVPQWGRTYYYKVRAYCTTTSLVTTYSSFSGYKYAKPNWITPGLTAASPNYYSIVLSWNTVPHADYYYVWRSTYNGGYTKVLDSEQSPIKVYAAGDTAGYTDEMTADMVGRTYYYKVQPVDAEGGALGLGPYSGYKYARASWQTLNLNAAALTYHSISLSWNKVAEAEYYYVWRSTYNGEYAKLLDNELNPKKVYADGDTVGYTDESLIKGTTYYYKVQPIDEDQAAPLGIGPLSAYRYAKADWPKINLTAAAINYYSVSLNWNAITLANKYEIYRSTSYRRGYEKIGETGESFYEDKDPDLILNKTYYYRIKPFEGAAEGPLCSYKSAKPAWPKITLTAVSGGYNSIVLTWNGVDGADGYVIKIKNPDGLYREVNESTTSYTDKGLSTGKTYYYWVMPYDEIEGEDPVYGPYSSYRYAKPVPAVTSAVTLEEITPPGIRVSWEAVEGASGYLVYRATSLRGTYVLAATQYTGTSFENTGLTIGKTYYYKVRAFTTVGSVKVYGAYSYPIGLKLILTA